MSKQSKSFRRKIPEARTKTANKLKPLGSRIRTRGTLMKGKYSYQYTTPVPNPRLLLFWWTVETKRLTTRLQNSNVNGKVPDLDETLQYSAFISSATFKALISICEKLESLCGLKKKHAAKVQQCIFLKRCLKKMDAPTTRGPTFIKYINYNNGHVPLWRA